MAQDRHLNLDRDFVFAVQHNLMPADFKTFLESFMGNNGFVQQGFIFKSEAFNSSRNDIDKGKEFIGIQISLPYLKVGQGFDNSTNNLGGVVAEEDYNAGNTWPISATLSTDGTNGGSQDATVLIVYTVDSVNNRTLFILELHNRERSQSNLKMITKINTPGPATVQVTLPKDSGGDYFFPDIYNPFKPNFKGKVRLTSIQNDPGDFIPNIETEIGDITNVSSINLIAGTATIEVSNLTKFFAIGTLIGIDPQPVSIFKNGVGKTIRNGIAEAATLRTLADDPVSNIPEMAEWVFSDAQGEIAGRILGTFKVLSNASVLDGQEIPVWKRPRNEEKSRIMESRKIDTIPVIDIGLFKTNYV